MFYRLSIAAIAAMIVSSGSMAEAGDGDYPRYSFSGFGTAGAVHSNEKRADFTPSIFKPSGAGASRSWSAEVDSLLGAQLRFDATPSLSGALQVVAEQRYDGSWRPGLEWTNIKYQLTPDFSLRLGRVALPGFMASEYRKVGFAMPWVRAPRDLYSLAPVTSSDGIDASYRLHLGQATNTAQAYIGQRDMGTPFPDGRIRFRRGVGLTDTIDFDPFTLRVSYQRGTLSMNASRAFFDRVRRLGPEGNALAERYDIYDKPYRLMSVGAGYDRGPWLLAAEWARLRTSSLIGDGTGWYLSGAHRVGRFTPYLVYSRVRLDSPRADSGIATGALPPVQAAAARQANRILNAFLGNAMPDARTMALGSRWDIGANLALKLQYERINIGAGSSGGLKQQRPGFTRGGALSVLSVSADFVF